jgi:hypothetical protein
MSCKVQMFSLIENFGCQFDDVAEVNFKVPIIRSKVRILDSI